MKKANFTNPLRWMVLSLLALFAWSTPALAQCNLTANNGVQVSTDPTPGSGCSITITPDMVLEDFTNALNNCAGGDPNNFFIELLQGNNTVLQSGNGSITQTGSFLIGRTYTVRISAGGNAAWGRITVEDKAAPVLSCLPVTLTCGQDRNPRYPQNHPNAANAGEATFPTATDNCSAGNQIRIILSDQQPIDDDFCDGNGQTYIYTWIAVDQYGNASDPCVQSIIINRAAGNGVSFPNDIEWTCNQYNAFNGVIDAQPTHPFLGDSDPSTPLMTEVNLSFNDDLDRLNPFEDDVRINSTNTANGGNGGARGVGLGLDDQDVLALSGSADFGSGTPTAGQACNFNVQHNDVTLPACGSTFKIIRTWTVLDWCNNQVITSDLAGRDNVQVIKISDKTPPTVSRNAFTVDANIPGVHPQPCRSTGIIPTPTVADNCSGTDTRVFIFTRDPITGFFTGNSIGEALPVLSGTRIIGYRIPAPGIAVGAYLANYQVTDECGNFNQAFVAFDVEDNTVPTVVCDQITDVSLSSDGFAVVNANVFDDGSYDNCCLERFDVRRMTPGCGTNSAFGPTVTFCCDDVPNSPVMVEMRVTDCYGNSNSCMVEVFVEDKIAPQCLSTPATQFITCDMYFQNLQTPIELGDSILFDLYGDATFFDNCVVDVTYSESVNIDNCGVGTITRSWEGRDNNPNNRPARCSQTIFVSHVSDWVVEFPDDVAVTCDNTSGINLDDAATTGEPIIFFETCELIGITYEDRTFTNVPDACYKIERTWTVINWCIYDANLGNPVVESAELTIVTRIPDAIRGDVSASTYDPAQDLHPRGAGQENGLGDERSGTIDDHLPEAGNTVSNDARTFKDGLSLANFPNAQPDGYITYKQVIKVDDEVPPVLTCTDREFCQSTSSCGPVFSDLSIIVTDVCSAEFEYEYAIDAFYDASTPFQADFTGNGDNANIANGNYPIGVHLIRWSVEDRCGNASVCEFEFEVKDCKKPTPYCKNGLVIEIMQTGMVSTWASDFNDGSFDNCPGTLQFSFSSNVLDTGRLYTCDSLGQRNVQIWVTDASGNQDFCETFVIIQDNMNACGGATPRTLAGTITNEANTSVEDVMVTASGSNNSDFNEMTDVDGDFSFNLIEGNDYTVSPMKDTRHNNGVTTYDLFLIAQHILGNQLLDSPYKIIAADANHDERVTARDLLEIRSLILTNTSAFASNTSWRFVPNSFVFSSPTAPFTVTPGYTAAQPFPEVISINNLDRNQLNANFTAIKVGDVNMTAATSNVLGLDDRTFQGEMTIGLADQALVAGNEYTVDFTAADLAAVGFQFTLNFDATAVQVVDVVEGMATRENFGFAQIDNGAITASFNTNTGIIANDAVLFSLVVKASANANLSEVLSINSRYTAAEAYTANGDITALNLDFGKGGSAAGFDLLQNTPNPFNGATVIGFELPQAGDATLTITDVAGKVLFSTTQGYAKGYNQVTVSKGQLNAVGVVFYTLQAANQSATKRMIIMD